MPYIPKGTATAPSATGLLAIATADTDNANPGREERHNTPYTRYIIT